MGGIKGPRALLIHGLTSSARSWWRLGAEKARLVRDRRDDSLVLAERPMGAARMDDWFEKYAEASRNGSARPRRHFISPGT